MELSLKFEQSKGGCCKGSSADDRLLVNMSAHQENIQWSVSEQDQAFTNPLGIGLHQPSERTRKSSKGTMNRTAEHQAADPGTSRNLRSDCETKEHVDHVEF